MATLNGLNVAGDLIEDKGTVPVKVEAVTTTPQIGPDSLDGEYSARVNAVSRIASTYTTAGKHVIFNSDGPHQYAEPRAVVATVTGSAIMYGTEVDTSGIPINHYDNSKGSSIAYDVANGKVLIAQGTDNNHGNYMVVGTISGDSISFGSVTTVDSGSTPNDNSMRPQGMVYVGGIGGDTTNRLVLATKHNSTQEGEARVITISGTTPTGGTVADWHTANEPNDFCMAYVGGGQVVIAYVEKEGGLLVRVGTVAGGVTNTITWGSAVTCGSVSTSFNQLAIAYDEQNSKVVIAFVAPVYTTRGRIIAGTVSGTGASGTFAFSGADEFETDGTCTAISAEYHAAAQKILISYKSAGSTSPQVIAATFVSYGVANADDVIYSFGTATPIMSASTPAMTTTSYDALNKKVIVFRDGAIGTKHGLSIDLLTSTLTLDLSTGSFFELDLEPVTSDIGTFTITETLSGQQVKTFSLKIIQGTIPIEFSWGSISNIKWPGGTGPTLTPINNAIDILQFTTYDAGTTWHGEIIGLNFS